MLAESCLKQHKPASETDKQVLPEGAALYCPKGLVGRGVSRGTSFPLNPTEGLGTLDVVPRLFVTFCAQKVRRGTGFCRCTS